MKTTVTINDVLGADQAIQECRDIDMPALLSFQLSKLRKKLSSTIDAFNESSKELFDSFSEEQEGAEPLVPQEKIPEYQKALNDILMDETTVTFDPIKLAAFADAGNIKNSIIMRLSFALKE